MGRLYDDVTFSSARCSLGRLTPSVYECPANCCQQWRGLSLLVCRGSPALTASLEIRPVPTVVTGKKDPRVSPVPPFQHNSRLHSNSQGFNCPKLKFSRLRRYRREAQFHNPLQIWVLPILGTFSPLTFFLAQNVYPPTPRGLDKTVSPC